MELFLIYAWLKLDLFIFCAILLGACALGLGVLLPSIVLWIDGDQIYDNYVAEWRITHAPKWIALRRIGVLILIPTAFFALFMPSAKEAAILVASAVAIDVAKSPEGAKVGQLIRNNANELLDAELVKSTKVKTR